RSATAFLPWTRNPRPGRGRGSRRATRAAMRPRRRSPWCGSSGACRQPGEILMARPAAPRKDARKANRRGAARLAAVQALYQMDIAGTPLNDIVAEFESHWIGQEVEGSQYLPAEAAFFRSVLRGVLDDQRGLDPLIDKVL